MQGHRIIDTRRDPLFLEAFGQFIPPRGAFGGYPYGILIINVKVALRLIGR